MMIPASCDIFYILSMFINGPQHLNHRTVAFFIVYDWMLHITVMFVNGSGQKANQNGHDMVQHVLLPVNINFHWNLFIFEFLTNYFYFFHFYIGGHFENLKKQRLQLWVMIYFQIDPLYGFRLTCFAPLLPWQRPPFWIFSTPKAATHYGGYSYKASWSLIKGIQIFLNPPFFVSMATAVKFVQPIPIFV